jgi:hypothetical protein
MDSNTGIKHVMWNENIKDMCLYPKTDRFLEPTMLLPLEELEFDAEEASDDAFLHFPVALFSGDDS